MHKLTRLILLSCLAVLSPLAIATGEAPFAANTINAPSVAHRSAPLRPNLAVIMDVVGIEGIYGKASFCQLALSNMLSDDDACILTTINTLQNLVNCTVHPYDSPAKRKIDFEIQESCSNFNKFDFYSDGFFVLLVPNLLDRYASIINIAATDLKAISAPKASYQLSPWPLAITKATRWIGMPFNELRKSSALITLLGKLFTKQEGIAWNVYMAGHGLPAGSTCGISETSFKQLLKFLTDGINTKLFRYDSCYVSGKMSEYIYDDHAQYPFTIICRCLGDNMAYGAAEKGLFHALAQIKESDEAQAIADYLPKDPIAIFNICNIVQVRKSHNPAFTLTNLNDDAQGANSTFCIDQNATAAQLQNPPGDHLILNTPYIASPIRLGVSSMMHTALKGDCVHYLAKIETSHDKEDFFAMLSVAGIANELIQKIFLIKDVALIDGPITYCMAFINSPTPSSFLGIPWPQTLFDLAFTNKAFSIFYMEGAQGWIAREKEDPDHKSCMFEHTKLSSEDTKAYLALFHKLHARIQKGERPQRLLDNKHLRRIAEFRYLLALGYLAAAGYSGLNAYAGMNSLLGDNLTSWIQQPICAGAGLMAGAATTAGLLLTDYIIAKKLRYWDLGEK